MTVNGSSSSAVARPEVDLLAAGRFAPLPAALLAGEARELLAPLRFLAPGDLPDGAPPVVDRGALAAALAVTNAAYGHPRAAELAARLADPATRVVVTGQQTGLFGGPLYTLVKAMAAARYAELLSARGTPAVAVFWMATEDHDWVEAASATFAASDGPRRFDLGPDPSPLLPVGLRTFGPGIERVLAELAAAFPGERWASWLATLARWYRPDSRFGEAFARLLAHLLGERCPLLLDAFLPELKAAEAPWLAQLVARGSEVEAALGAAEGALRARGFALQVPSRPGASPLFLLRGAARRRIEWRGADRFALRGAEGGDEPIARLLETLADNPAAVSPGVLARSVVQDAVLGTTLQVLGAAEVSYLAQVGPLYALLGVVPPCIALRPQALVLDSRQQEHLADFDLDLAAVLADPAAGARRLGERGGAGFLAPGRVALEALLADWRGPALAIDSQLERPWQKTRDQILGAASLFAEKTAAAAARRDETAGRRWSQLLGQLLPGGEPQDRVIATAHFPGKYGEAFVPALWERLELDPRRLAVVVP